MAKKKKTETEEMEHEYAEDFAGHIELVDEYEEDIDPKALDMELEVQRMFEAEEAETDLVPEPEPEPEKIPQEIEVSQKESVAAMQTSAKLGKILQKEKAHGTRKYFPDRTRH
jgi:hypothetical protein